MIIDFRSHSKLEIYLGISAVGMLVFKVLTIFFPWVISFIGSGFFEFSTCVLYIWYVYEKKNRTWLTHLKVLLVSFLCFNEFIPDIFGIPNLLLGFAAICAFITIIGIESSGDTSKETRVSNIIFVSAAVIIFFGVVIKILHLTGGNFVLYCGIGVAGFWFFNEFRKNK